VKSKSISKISWVSLSQPNFIRIDGVLCKIWQKHFGVFFSVHSVDLRLVKQRSSQRLMFKWRRYFAGIFQYVLWLKAKFTQLWCFSTLMTFSLGCYVVFSDWFSCYCSFSLAVCSTVDWLALAVFGVSCLVVYLYSSVNDIASHSRYRDFDHCYLTCCHLHTHRQTTHSDVAYVHQFV